MKNKNYTSEEIHSKLLEMAKDFHDLCEKNHIDYYVIGGTCLGAVRHKGFIPWDDDMDIGIPRKDYNRFVSLSKSAFPKKYELRFYKNTKESPMHYVKFIDNTTTLIEKEYKNYVEGVYIDVFPLDEYENSGAVESLLRKIVLFCNGLVLYHCSTQRKAGVKRIVQLFSKLMSVKVLHEIEEIIMRRTRNPKSKYLINYLGAWGEREIHLKETFGSPKKYEFENIWLYGPSDADRYLSTQYGDYMCLPPEKDRVFRHNYYYINLSLPYREFLKRNRK